MKTKRIVSADLLRFVAILGVVTIHVTDSLINIKTFFGGLTWWYSNIINSISRISVPLFIILSGYLLLVEYRKESVKSFLSRRLVRIGIPLLFWVVFSYLWKYYWFGDIITASILTEAILSTRIFHLYFLIIILELYLLTPYLRSFIKKLSINKLKIVTIFFLSASFALTLIGYLFHISSFPNNFFLISFFYVGYYLYGGYIRKSEIELKKFDYVLAVGGVLIFALVTAFLTHWNMQLLNMNIDMFWTRKLGQYFYDNLSFNVTLMSLVSFVLLIYTDKLIKNKTIMKKLHLLSTTSFGVYLIHPFIIDLVDHYTFLNISKIYTPLFVFITLKIVVVYALSFFLVLIISKVPVLKAVVGEGDSS